MVICKTNKVFRLCSFFTGTDTLFGTVSRYEHDTFSDTHFVEVVPNDVYYLNERYIAWESKMFDEFVNQFPHENIGFKTDDALVG
jgi:hypothetical protein